MASAMVIMRRSFLTVTKQDVLETVQFQCKVCQHPYSPEKKLMIISGLKSCQDSKRTAQVTIALQIQLSFLLDNVFSTKTKTKLISKVMCGELSWLT